MNAAARLAARNERRADAKANLPEPFRELHPAVLDRVWDEATLRHRLDPLVLLRGCRALQITELQPGHAAFATGLRLAADTDKDVVYIKLFGADGTVVCEVGPNGGTQVAGQTDHVGPRERSFRSQGRLHDHARHVIAADAPVQEERGAHKVAAIFVLHLVCTASQVVNTSWLGRNQYLLARDHPTFWGSYVKAPFIGGRVVYRRIGWLSTAPPKGERGDMVNDEALLIDYAGSDASAMQAFRDEWTDFRASSHGHKFVPLAVESHGGLGKGAMRLLNFL